MRQLVAGRSTVGITATSTVRGYAEAADAWQDAHVLRADFDLRGRSDFTATGSFGGGLTKACDPRLSSTHHGRGICEPFGGFLAFGKTGGAVQIVETIDYTGAEVDANDLGFIPHLLGNTNLGQVLRLSYVRERPWRGLRTTLLSLLYATAWDPSAGAADVATPMTDHRVIASAEVFLRNDWHLTLSYNHAFPFNDDLET